MENAGDDWARHKLLVLDKLERLKEQQSEIRQEVQVVAHNILGLQLEATTFGAMARIIPAVIISVIAYLNFHNMLKG
jgi:hypothetical protein